MTSFGSERLAVADLGNQRVTLLSPTGQVERTIGFDGHPWLVRDAVDSVVVISESTIAHWLPSADSARRRTRVARVGSAAGGLQWDTLVLPETVALAESPMVAGTWSPDHGYVFVQHPYRMVRFSPAGEFLGVLTPDHYTPELPSDRDVEARISDLTRLFGSRPGADAMEEWRKQPKPGVVALHQVTFSEDGLLWVATTRDRTRWSYVDAYAGAGARYLGSVRVRDRLLAFDVRDGTLAALVERPDPQGLLAHAIDWYDVRPWVEAVTGP